MSGTLLFSAPIFPPDSLGIKVKEGKVYVLHRVDKGETITLLSRRYQCSAIAIVDANDLRTNALTVGQELLVPAKNIKANLSLNDYASSQNAEKAKPIAPPEKVAVTQTPKPGPPVNPQSKPVPTSAKGEVTPQSKVSVSPEKVPVKSPPKPAVISEKAVSISPAKTNPEETSAPEKMRIHIVESGQTLFSISKQYKISVEEIKSINGLVNNDLKLGRKLKIPAAEGAVPIQPSLSKTDSSKIEKGLSLPVEKTISNVEKAEKTVPRIAEEAKVAPLPEKVVQDSSAHHWVRKGETLYSLSHKYSVTVNELREWNGLFLDNVKADSWILVKHPESNLDSKLEKIEPIVQKRETILPPERPTENPIKTIDSPAPKVEEAVVSKIETKIEKGEGLKTSENGKPISTPIEITQTLQEPLVSADSENKVAQESIILKGEAEEVAIQRKVVLPPGSLAEKWKEPFSGKEIYKTKEVGRSGLLISDEHSNKKFYATHPLIPVGTLVRVENPNSKQVVTVEILELSKSGDPYLIRLSKKARAYLMLENESGGEEVIIRYSLPTQE